MKRKLLFQITGFLILSFPWLAYSASEFSAKAIFFQAFNFFLFFLAFLFLVKKPLKAFFHQRQKDFFSFEEKSLNLEKKLKKELEIWDEKLKDLNSKKNNIKKQAQDEGNRFMLQKKQELESLKKKFKKTSDFLISLEKQKLKRESLRHWRSELVEKTREELSELSLSENFQKKEQESFLTLLSSSRLFEKAKD
ncbi:MAG: hypothetical protein OXC37_04830 [Bdellovibrionaceae bacterium]|nr:hypothetical protein [Pseudobdellovibrionaceae bacterium]